MLSELQTIVERESGLTTIWEQPNAPRPPRPFVSLYVTSLQALGHDEDRGIDDDGQQHILGQRLANVSIAIRSDATAPPHDALDKAMALQFKLRNICTNKLSLANITNVLNVPQSIGSQIQPQAVIDVQVLFGITNEREADWIETVIGQYVIQREDGTDMDTINFETEI